MLMIVLAVSSSFRANEVVSSRPTATEGTSAPLAWVHAALESLPLRRDRKRQLVFLCNIFSLSAWVMFVVGVSHSPSKLSILERSIANTGFN